ncbi:hypothetical protein HMPREF0294_0567 [Corynebacterium glucuronolyticum ATCC 51867]|nr:hypothetical protein HMPREF0294_0567 [Corynebacterium glucuronolyticum ATCC 51867]
MFLAQGSSPQVRGRYPSFDKHAHLPRLIPAGAGQMGPVGRAV